MKVSLTLFALFSPVFVVGGPSKPEIYIGLNSESLDNGVLGALEPAVKWQTSGKLADCDVEGGVTMSVTNQAKSMPYSMWGRIKKTVSGVDLSARVDTESSNLNLFALDLQAGMGGTNIQVKGKADADSSTVSVDNVQLSQNLEAVGGSWTITPKYTLASQKGDVTVKYGVSNTIVTVDADMDKQKVTVKQTLPGDIGSVTPSLTSEGDLEIGYSKPVGTGVISAMYKPNAYLDLKYEDGPWVASIRAPVDSFDQFSDRLTFNVRRAVDVTGAPAN